MSKSRKGFGFTKFKKHDSPAPQLDALAEVFIEHLVNHKYAEAQKLLIEHPHLATTIAPQITDASGCVFKDIPVFKYVLWTGNMVGMEMFPRDINPSDTEELSRLLDTLEKQAKEFVKNGVTYTLKDKVYKDRKGDANEDNLKLITDSISTRKAKVKDIQLKSLLSNLM